LGENGNDALGENGNVAWAEIATYGGEEENEIENENGVGGDPVATENVTGGDGGLASESVMHLGQVCAPHPSSSRSSPR
jgi:hypothetical protein